MNVYDTANQLASEIQNSEEYIQYKEIRENVQKDPTLKQKIDEFDKLRYDIQIAAMNGETMESEKGIKLQQMYSELAQNCDVKEYFDLQIKFNIMLADVNKIIAESVRDLI